MSSDTYPAIHWGRNWGVNKMKQNSTLNGGLEAEYLSYQNKTTNVQNMKL